MNNAFDVDAWLWRFPLSPTFPQNGGPGLFSAEMITGPSQICNNEQLRRALTNQYDWGPPVPMDVFVMSKGEPERRDVTKIAGLPYRPADAPWPSKPSGEPLAFLGQFNFTDSRDIIGETPGDVLLVFGDDVDFHNEPKHFEWQPLGLSDLAMLDQLSPNARKIAPCFGNRCRTANYPEAVPKFKGRYPLLDGLEVWSPYWIPMYQATQIGRAPYFIPEEDDSLPGSPLCTISSVQPDQHARYPWVNVSEPLNPPDKWMFGGDELMIGDAGCIYIFMDDDGTVHACESCY